MSLQITAESRESVVLSATGSLFHSLGANRAKRLDPMLADLSAQGGMSGMSMSIVEMQTSTKRCAHTSPPGDTGLHIIVYVYSTVGCFPNSGVRRGHIFCGSAKFYFLTLGSELLSIKKFQEKDKKHFD